MTLFPELIKNVLGESIIGRAQKSGKVEIVCTNIRDFAGNKHNRVDDILDIKVKGNLKYIDSISQCLIKYTVSGVMKVKCAITNEELDYKFSDEEEVSFTFDSNEEDDEIIYAKGNVVDLAPIVWQLIVVNIPLKVVKYFKEGCFVKYNIFTKE